MLTRTQPAAPPNDSLEASAAAVPESVRFIYIACPWSPAGGGMYKVAEYLIQAQAPVTPVGGARLRSLDTRGPGSAWASFLVLLGALWKLVRARLDGRLAGVHVNMAERLSLFRKGTIVVASRALGVPVVIHLHGQMQAFHRRLPAPVRALVRWVFSLASTVIVIGAAQRRFVMDEVGVPAHRIEIAINGVPGPACLRPRRDPSLLRVLFVGRLCESKGVSDLLKALARGGLDPSRVEVTLAGGGDIARYQAQARSLGLADLVRFAGWCERAQVDELLAQADVLVLPSHDEVLPLVVLEALSHGVAVLCTPVGELPSVLCEGKHACFVPVGDVDALARGLHRLLQDAELREALARNGRALYETQFALGPFFDRVAHIHQRHFGVAGRRADVGAAQGDAR